jgi:ATP-dependent RNA circularization protein (DNA/RNA ligase family)
MAKYPRTPHLSISPGKSKDDKVTHSDEFFVGEKVIISEKIDGSNVCMTEAECFARSHSGSPTHESFDAFKALHAEKKNLIPYGVELFGEWCYAMHSIYYDRLPSYFLLFAVRKNTEWFKWDDVLEIADTLNLCTVPFFNKRIFSNITELHSAVRIHMKEPSFFGEEKEGLVLRIDKTFSDDNFSSNVAKYVRKNHVQTDKHWKHSEIIRNKLL